MDSTRTANRVWWIVAGAVVLALLLDNPLCWDVREHPAHGTADGPGDDVERVLIRRTDGRWPACGHWTPEAHGNPVMALAR